MQPLENRNRATKGVLWSAIERFSSQGVQFVVSIIIARVLIPADYGIIAMAMIMLSILQVVNESGFGAALIHKLDRDKLDYSSIFVFNIALGVFLYLVTYLFAPFIARFFNEPVLTGVIRLLGITLIINSFVIVQRTILYIHVDFKTQAKASVVGTILSGTVGVYLAYQGYGVMALVVQSILFSIINVVIIWIKSKYIPNLHFSMSRFKPMFKYSYKLISARLINVFFEQGYSILIGKLYLPAQLGYFNRAVSFYNMSSNNITGIVQRVSTPMLCEAQNDHAHMRQVLIGFIRNTSFVVFPLIFGIFVLSNPLVVTLLTEKWLYTAYILRILCPVGILYVFSTFNRNVFNATGRTGLALKSELFQKIFFILIMCLVAFYGDFIQLVYSQILIAIIEFIIVASYTKKQIDLGVWQQIKAVKDILILSLLMSVLVALSVYFIDNNFLKLLVGTLVGVVFYGTISYVRNIADCRRFLAVLKYNVESKH